jgi:hypothetical protein
VANNESARTKNKRKQFVEGHIWGYKMGDGKKMDKIKNATHNHTPTHSIDSKIENERKKREKEHMVNINE